MMLSPIVCMQAVVKLPFASVKRLAAAAQQADPNEQELTPADEVTSTFTLHSFLVLLCGVYYQTPLSRSCVFGS